VSATRRQDTQVVTGELHRVRRGRGKGFTAEPPPGPSRQPARVTVTLALAHTIQRAIDRGRIRDQAEAARRLGLTRARLTQIMDLTLIAPDVQEEILFLEATGGVEPLSGNALRDIVYRETWMEQRHTFALVRQPRRKAS